MFRPNMFVIGLVAPDANNTFRAWLFNLSCFMVLAFFFFTLTKEWSWKFNGHTLSSVIPIVQCADLPQVNISREEHTVFTTIRPKVNINNK